MPRQPAPPRTAVLPRITLVGPGNLANALAAALHIAGYVIEAIVASGRAGSLRRARILAKKVGALAVTAEQSAIHAEVVWFCVPDGAIAGAAKTLKPTADWTGKIALHSSGALSSDELATLRRAGAAVASAHPLMTFVRRSRIQQPGVQQPGVRQPRVRQTRVRQTRARQTRVGQSTAPLAGVPFAMEGDKMAVRAARRIVKHLGGESCAIRKHDKAAYHAWASFASPLLTALLVTSEQVAAAAGLRPAVAKKRMLPMIRQTLANYAAWGGSAAFSGPIVRGDAATIKRHLDSLRTDRIAGNVYRSLVRAAVAYLPGKNKKMVRAAVELPKRKGAAPSGVRRKS